jgi:hypothetical protein
MRVPPSAFDVGCNKRGASAAGQTPTAIVEAAYIELNMAG